MLSTRPSSIALRPEKIPPGLAFRALDRLPLVFIQDLGTAVELALPLPIILWDNGKLKEIEDAMVRAQIAPKAVIARNPDFCALARAYGAHAAAPATLDEAKPTLGAVFKTCKGCHDTYRIEDE